MGFRLHSHSGAPRGAQGEDEASKRVLVSGVVALLRYVDSSVAELVVGLPIPSLLARRRGLAGHVEGETRIERRIAQVSIRISSRIGINRILRQNFLRSFYYPG